MKPNLGVLWVVSCACVGGFIGLLLTNVFLVQPALERLKENHPNESICGNFGMPYDCFALGVGLPAGTWFGLWTARRYSPGWWRLPPPTA